MSTAKNQVTKFKPNLEATVARMKSEILYDMAVGRVPRTVKSFSELHDHVDANEYGGFCEDGYEMSEGCEFENAAQDTVHVWLAAVEELPLGAEPNMTVYVQTRKAPQQSWFDSLGTLDVARALEFVEHERSHGNEARLVVKTLTVIG